MFSAGGNRVVEEVDTPVPELFSSTTRFVTLLNISFDEDVVVVCVLGVVVVGLHCVDVALCAVEGEGLLEEVGTLTVVVKPMVVELVVDGGLEVMFEKKFEAE